MIQCFSTIKTSMRILHCQLKRLKNRNVNVHQVPPPPFQCYPLFLAKILVRRGGGGGGPT